MCLGSAEAADRASAGEAVHGGVRVGPQLQCGSTPAHLSGPGRAPIQQDPHSGRSHGQRRSQVGGAFVVTTGLSLCNS